MKYFRSGLLALAACMVALIAARMFFGPFRFGLLSVTTPLNPEGLLGLAITLLVVSHYLGSVGPKTSLVSPWTKRDAALAALAILAITFIALRRALGIYFLSDDFALVKVGHDWTTAMFRYTISHGQGDGFFRPIGYVSFALDARLGAAWGGIDPVVSHASSLAIHTANSALTMLMARRLGASASAAGIAGALFAVHGIHLETAVWIAGRFDLLATLFLLSGLLLFTATEKRPVLHIPALACFALAMYSKEAAFIAPLLVGGWALWRRQPLRWTVPYFALAAIQFAYRWSLVGGIGGYVDRTTGRPAVLSLGFGSTLKAVFVRLWTSLYFPVNWSTDPALPLAVLAVAYMAALIWLALRARLPRPVWPAATALLICVIPVLSLLAGTPTLAGSRVLYLPSVWFAILLGLALDGLATRERYAVAAAVLVFQFAALQHNLGFWESASALVKAECATGAPVLPDSIDGVPVYANGRQECIEIGRLKTGQP